MKKHFFTMITGVILLSMLPTRSNAQEPFLAEVRIFAGNFAPRGWAFCQGQLLAINQNQALFSLLGTTYGGDGRTTFALPDLRGRVAVGMGSGPGLTESRLGQKTGAESMTLTQNHLPAHAHGIDNLQELQISLKGPGSKDASDPKMVITNAVSGSNPVTVSTKTTGGNQSFNIEQPSLGVNYIIALQGLFPSRN